jgi:hypothetical protein
MKDYEFQDYHAIKTLYDNLEDVLYDEDIVCYRSRFDPGEMLLKKGQSVVARLRWSKYDNEGNKCQPRLCVSTFFGGHERKQGAVGVDDLSVKQLLELIK